MALAFDRQPTLSRIALGVTAFAWLGLAVCIAFAFATDRRGVLAKLRSPASLTWVAASAVLGSRLGIAGHRTAAGLLLVLAVVTWILLTLALVRTAGARRLPRTGAAFMLVVAPQSLAVLAAPLASTGHEHWLLYSAMVGAALGLAVYPYAFTKFDPRELVRGSGEHWVAGGALAISALSFAELALAAERLHAAPHLVSALRTVALIVWVAAFVWLPVLVGAELARPRLRFTESRWSTVFPVGMYAACSFGVATSNNAAAIHEFARVWVWPALAIWLVVLAATIRAYGGYIPREHG